MDKNINGGIKMNENVELLNYIHEDSLMGISSLTTIAVGGSDCNNNAEMPHIIAFSILIPHNLLHYIMGVMLDTT